MNKATLSIITAIKPTRLSKGFSLGAGGDLLKQAGGHLSQGKVEIRELSTLADLGAILQSLTPAQALVYGAPKNTATKVMTRKAFTDSGKPHGAATRTNDAFAWPQGAGVMMLDYDPAANDDPLDRNSLVQAIRKAAPGLVDAGLLWWPSASSCIWQGEKELRGVKGQRLYMLVQDAADIPRAGQVLVDRLWLAGHGHIEISKSGAMLERTLVDASVWQQSRLDFAGGAACGAGLDQRRGDPFLINAEALPTDTRDALYDLTAQERDQLNAIKSKAKSAAKPDAKEVKEIWVAERVKEITALTDQSDKEAIERAEKSARRALETGNLAGDFVVQVERDGRFISVTVGDLLDNRNKYHGCITRDPIEPDYDGGRTVGRLYLMQARPSLHSFAHGGKTYRLQRALARVELVRGHTSEAATATIELMRHDPMTYDFGGQLALAEDGRLHALCEAGLAHHLGNTTQFWKYVQQGNIVVPVDSDPPPGLLKQVIAQSERRKLKPIEGVITAPTIRRNGSALISPGYDAETRLLFDPLGEDVPNVPSNPTLDDASRALETLLHPFSTFPFVDASAKGALLAAILTAVTRPVLPTAPAIAFDAPIQGSGKTLLANCIGALIEGRAPDIWPHTQGRDDEETRKRLFTALRTGGKALIWDNVIGIFDSASMAAFITADAMIDRVLGKSEAIRIPNRAMLILTGNNLSLAGDLPRRVIICRIDPETDQPFARQFDVDPLQWVLDHRLEMVVAACILIRARFTHLHQRAQGRLASFETWDDLVRQTVCWADSALCPHEFGDPMDLVREAQAADPEADALFALLDALRDQFDTAEFTAKEVQSVAKGVNIYTPVETALLDLAGDRALQSVKSLGRILRFREGRFVHGLRLIGRVDKSSGSRVYRVQADEGTNSQQNEFDGFDGFDGFLPNHTEKAETLPLYKEGETNPLNPSNPFASPLDDVFDPDNWA